MSDERLRQLHQVYVSNGDDERTRGQSPALQKLLKEPHLALLINGNWLPIVPGMCLALVTDRSHIDGIAPYYLAKVNTKPGKEYIELEAWSTNVRNTRKLRLGAKYSGHFASPINDADQAVDAAVKATKPNDWSGQDED